MSEQWIEKYKGCIGECCPGGFPPPMTKGMICHTFSQSMDVTPRRSFSNFEELNNEESSFTTAIPFQYDCQTECLRPRADIAPHGYIYKQTIVDKTNGKTCVCTVWPERNDKRSFQLDNSHAAPCPDPSIGDVCFLNPQLSPTKTCLQVIEQSFQGSQIKNATRAKDASIFQPYADCVITSRISS